MGDPVCWLDLTCPTCGALRGQGGEGPCPRCGDPARAEELRDVLRPAAWLHDLLAVVRDSGLPDAWIGAGAVRDVVLDAREGRGCTLADVRDVDVVFLDPDDRSRQRDADAEDRLRAARPDVPWQARNQAAVHCWYADRFGVDVPPLTSIADAVATWPEPASCVAVRLGEDDRLDVCAPLGLEDLLEGIWRRNPRSPAREVYAARLARKAPAVRWPSLRVVEDGPITSPST